MKNNDIREEIERKRLHHYEVAEKLGISPWTLSVWLRSELNEERKNRIKEAINSFSV